MDPAVLDILRRSSKIAIDREGRWLHDGAAIENPKISALFDRGIGRTDSGEPRLTVGTQWCYIELADTLYVVRELTREANSGAFKLRLNDGSAEPLVADTLEFRGDSDLYCRVKGATECARFSRHAFNALSGFLQADDDGTIHLLTPAGLLPISVRPAAETPDHS